MNSYSTIVILVLSCIALCQCDQQSSATEAAAAAAASSATSSGPDDEAPCGEDFACTADYSPVCGKLQIAGQLIYVTFPNKCELDLYNCHNPKSKYSLVSTQIATCDQQQKYSKCSGFCYLVVKPICAERYPDGCRTFTNDCFFWSENCKNSQNQWTYVKDGQC